MTSTLIKLDDYLSAQIVDYLDAESLLAAEQSISQWRPEIADRWKVLDESMASVSVAQSRADTPRKRVWRFQHCAETAAIHARTRFQTLEQCPDCRDWRNAYCEIFLRVGRQEDQSVIWQGFVQPMNPWPGMEPWRPSATLDGQILLDRAREREILNRWPELKEMQRHRDLFFAIPDDDDDDDDDDDIEAWDNFQSLESIMRNITLTIVRINRAGTFLEYSGTGLKGCDDYYHYWAPYPEEEPWKSVRFETDNIQAPLNGFGLGNAWDSASVSVFGEEWAEDESIQEEPYLI